MEFHEFANIFPSFTGEQFESLIRSINKEGLSHPITLYENKILDGRHRYKVCQKLNIKPIYTEFKGTHEEALQFVLRENKERRNLNSAQLAAVAIESSEIFQTIRKEAKAKQREAGQYGKEGGRGKKKEETPTQKIEEGFTKSQKKKEANQRTADAQVADAYHTNRQYIADARELKKNNNELFEEGKTAKEC